MRITIDGVRMHDGKTFTFEENQLTLLDGRNGVGKSTLFDCIYWCLYGKVRDLCPVACQVVLEIKGVVITRKTRPNYLQVQVSTGVVENDEAQVLINKMFGSKLIFETSSYLQQGESCYLLTAPADGRMKVLNEMTFIDTDKTPKHFLDELSARQSKAKENQVKAETKYSVIQAQHENNKFVPTIDNVKVDDESVRNKKEQQLQVLKKKKQELSSQLASQKNELVHYKRLQKNLKDVENKLNGMKEEDVNKLSTKIEKLRKELITAQTNKKNKKSDERLLVRTQEELQATITRLNTYLSLQEQVNQYSETVTSFKGSVRKITDQWSQYNYQQQTLQQFPKVQTAEDITKAVEQLNKKYDKASRVEEQMKLHDEYVQVRKEKKELSSKIKEVVSEQMIEELEHKLVSMQASHDVYTCPDCHSSLRLQKGQLVRSKVAPVSKGEIQSLRQKIDFYKKQHQLLNTKKELSAKIKILRSKLPKDITYDENIQQTKKDILSKKGMLEAVVYVEKPTIALETLDAIQEYRSYLEKIKMYDVESIEEKIRKNKEMVQTLEQKIGEYHVLNINDLKSKLTDLEKRKTSAQQYVELVTKKEKLVQDMTHFNLQDGQDLEAKKKETIDKINSIKRYIQEYDNFTEQINRDDQLRDARKEKDTASNHYQRILQLKDLAVDLECYLIQKTVDDLNNIANDILDDICQGKMQIELTLFREVKSKKSFKNEVTLHVITGNTRKLFKHNSGGEKKIISFVFMVALCLLNPSPILLIDEALSEVDQEYRPACIQALRNYIDKSGKTVIFVNHNETEGDYDLVKFIE